MRGDFCNLYGRIWYNMRVPGALFIEDAARPYRCNRHRQPGGEGRPNLSHPGHAGAGGLEGGDGDIHRTPACLGVCRHWGYAGIDNTLFYRNNTMKLSGGANKTAKKIAKAMRRNRP
jgi:hypothetical protein